MPPESFLHERNDFQALIETVAENEKIHDPALVEKDYWIMHALFGLKQLGLSFELKGGTSLSKGFGIVHRFSEDIGVRIEPFDGLHVDTNPSHTKPAHIESRQRFFEKLQEKIKILGVERVERNTAYDEVSAIPGNRKAFVQFSSTLLRSLSTPRCTRGSEIHRHERLSRT